MPVSMIDQSSLLSGDRWRSPRLSGPARFLRRTRSSRDRLEERQCDWAYRKPVVALDALWNLAFVVVAGFVVYRSRDEKPVVPLRLWIVGYTLQCVLHIVMVLIEYKRRRRQEGEPQSTDNGHETGFRSEPDLEMGFGYQQRQAQSEEATSVSKQYESINTMFSFIWWILGFYWLSAGGQILTEAAPQLYWLCIIFLAFDVFLVIFCVALACIIGVAVCCCIPCIIGLLYYVADQEGASDEDICNLPKFKFKNGEKSILIQIGTDPPNEQILSPENAECCICLSQYEDGAELRELPCMHHFHSTCIDTWLHINATCPLCKLSVLKTDNNSSEEV